MGPLWWLQPHKEARPRIDLCWRQTQVHRVFFFFFKWFVDGRWLYTFDLGRELETSRPSRGAEPRHRSRTEVLHAKNKNKRKANGANQSGSGELTFLSIFFWGAGLKLHFFFFALAFQWPLRHSIQLSKTIQPASGEPKWADALKTTHQVDVTNFFLKYFLAFVTRYILLTSSCIKNVCGINIYLTGAQRITLWN